jgi:hypothetical protein
MCYLNPLFTGIRELFGGIRTFEKQRTMTVISEKSIFHYLTHLHKNNVTIACVNQVRPALSVRTESG